MLNMAAMKTKHIQAVIFDLGRVLVAIDSTILVEKLFSHISPDDPALAVKTMKDEDLIALCSGQIQLDEFHRRMSKKYQSDMGFGEFKQIWCSIFDTMDGAEALVTALKPTIKLGLLSDTDAVHWNFIKTTWPWLNVIENPTLSFEVGTMKPDPHIYLTAAQNVNTQPEHCLFIDDLENNVEGARAVGMHAVQFENIEQIRKLLTDMKLL